MGSIPGDINLLIQTNPWMAPLAVFLGGALTASNPCVLAMIPLMMAFVGAYKGTGNAGKAFTFSFLFVIGLTITFTMLGFVAALMGRLVGDVGKFWPYLVAAVCFIMGLHLLGVWNFDLPLPQTWKPKQGGPWGAFLLGLLFGVISTPCATPVLAVLLVYIASKGNLAYGGLLLFLYALGHCALILIAGTSMGLAKRLIESRGLNTGLAYLRKGSGVLIILIGFYFIWVLN
ncbi:MAG: cytochrome c biogenesis protein CcdA [Deltaproteobacteria bacterium]|nr:cytochrome c biogenesis protein CcdA [Deltaproteobacteria bacterium]